MVENSNFLDTWNSKTFDKELLKVLEKSRREIQKYFEREEFLDNHPDPDSIESILRKNEFADYFCEFIERKLLPLLCTRSMRAWHYTRLFDCEVSEMIEKGIQITGERSLSDKLYRLTQKGLLTNSEMNKLISGSPLQDSTQKSARLGKFWMVSQPLSIEDFGIRPLVNSWGGEIVYFWQKCNDLKEKLKNFGRTRIVEVVVPISNTKHGLAAANDIVRAYMEPGRHFPSLSVFDLYSNKNLDPWAIKKVHSQGEASFDLISKGQCD